MEFLLAAIPGLLALATSAAVVWRVGRMTERGGSEDPDGARARARRDAAAVIERAETEAREILQDAKALHARLSAGFERAVAEYLDAETARLNDTARRLAVEYQNLAEEARTTYARIIEDISKRVSDEARKGVVEFEGFVKSEMARYERLTDQSLEEWRRTMAAEIEKKKQEALARVESAIYRILFFVSKEVLGRAIDLETHRALVIRALEDAKRQGFFDV